MNGQRSPAVTMVPVMVLLVFTQLARPAHADVRTRYGALVKSDVSFELAQTVTWQDTNDERIRDEILMSVDLIAHRKMGDGQLTLYAEASTSPVTDGVSSLLAEANGDAASAVDSADRGRFQVSELHYTCIKMQHCTTYGLIDPSAFADISIVANDESSQFINTDFVNNPTIAFPDYTPGLVIHQDFTGTEPGYTWLLTLSHGLGDNQGRSYSELLDVDAPGKGLFSLLEFYRPAMGGMLRSGVWISSADHARFDHGYQDNYGIYLVMDNAWREWQWSLRLGAANPRVSKLAGYLGLALQRPLLGQTLGVALGRSMLSNEIDDPLLGDRRSFEIYLHFSPMMHLAISPSVQHIKNSGLDTSETLFDSSVTVIGVRASYFF